MPRRRASVWNDWEGQVAVKNGSIRERKQEKRYGSSSVAENTGSPVGQDEVPRSVHVSIVAAM